MKNSNTRVPVARPYISEKITKYLQDAIDAGELSGNFGVHIAKFEAMFSTFVDSKHSITVANGTCALHVALAALGIKAGDEVIVQSLTNMASAFAVSYTGAVPVPIDVEVDTCNINPELIEALISEKTKAILVVHLFGHPVDMDPVLAVARKHGLFVIEDCAEAHGAKYKGKNLGCLGDVGCYSFYANKIVATGEGGMITTNSDKIATAIRELKSLAYGLGGNRFMHEAIGFNYRMPNTIAAIGCAQLEDVNFVLERKQEIAHYYNEKLGGISSLQLPTQKDYAFNVYWMYHVILKNDADGRRDSVTASLDREGIETRVSFTPLNEQNVYINQGLVRRGDCPVASWIGRNGFYLPSGPLLTRQEQDKTIDALIGALN
jgi:perosamine synthetase